MCLKTVPINKTKKCTHKIRINNKIAKVAKFSLYKFGIMISHDLKSPL